MKPGKLTYRWFGPYRVQYALPNNTVLLVVLQHFDKNATIVNSNKLKKKIVTRRNIIRDRDTRGGPQGLGKVDTERWT